VVTVCTTLVSAEKLHFYPECIYGFLYDSHSEEQNHINGLLTVVKIKPLARTKVAFLLSVYPVMP
jgi:hypothetical protein